MTPNNPRVGSFGKSRDDVADPFTFSLEDEKWPDSRRRVVIEIKGGDPEDEEDAKAARKVADWIGDKGQVTRRDVETRFEWKRSTAARALDRAKFEGWIEEAGKGGQNGQATLWRPAYSPIEEASLAT